MSKPVTVYMTRWCSDCARARKVFERLGVAYEEIDIERVPGAEQKMKSVNGGSGKIPTILIGEKILIEPSDDELTRALQE